MAKLILFGLFVLYVGGVWKFWNGFSRTNFSGNLPYRLTLSLMWPALFVASKSYRQNFRKALKS
jgi:hypothetical protein